MYGVKFRIYRYRIVDQSSVQKYGVKFRILSHDSGCRIVDLSSVQKYGVKFRIYHAILDEG